MEYLSNFIAPELFILVPVLYLFGVALKKSAWFDDRYIPAILGALGMILATAYCRNLFSGITQGIICAGCSVYINQLIKQGAGK